MGRLKQHWKDKNLYYTNKVDLKRRYNQHVNVCVEFEFQTFNSQMFKGYIWTFVENNFCGSMKPKCSVSLIVNIKICFLSKQSNLNPSLRFQDVEKRERINWSLESHESICQKVNQRLSSFVLTYIDNIELENCSEP